MNKIYLPCKRPYVGLVIATIFLFISLSVVFSSRDASLYGTLAALNKVSSPLEISTLQVGTFVAIFLSLAIIFNTLGRRIRKDAKLISSITVVGAFFIFWFTQKISLGLSFGSNFKFQDLYTLVIFSAVVIARHEKILCQIRLLKLVLLILSVAGIFFLELSPAIVKQVEYSNAIYFDYRYWGLSTHANNLGPLMVLFGVLLFFFPYKNRNIQLAAYSVVLFSVVASQSKTTLYSCFGAIFLYQFVYISDLANKSGRQRWLLSIILVAIIIINSIILLFGKILTLNQYLTGRGDIWTISMLEFAAAPWFGGGANVWSNRFSEKYGYLGIASNAHNQVLDTLSLSGVAGFVALIYFLFTMVKVANLQNRIGHAFTWLLLFLMLRGFSEVPFRLGVAMSNDFGILLVLGMLAVGSIKSVNVKKLVNFRNEN